MLYCKCCQSEVLFQEWLIVDSKLICRPGLSCWLISFPRLTSFIHLRVQSVLVQAASILPLNRQIREALNGNGNDAAWFDRNQNSDAEVLISQFVHLSHKKIAGVLLLLQGYYTYSNILGRCYPKLINCFCVAYEVGGHCFELLTNLPYLFNGLIEVNVLCTGLVHPL